MLLTIILLIGYLDMDYIRAISTNRLIEKLLKFEPKLSSANTIA